MHKATLHIDELAVGYGQKVILDNLKLNIRQGELTCLLGSNGAGKSTLIRSISGVQKPLSGKVTLKERDIAGYNQKELAKELSLVLTDNQAPGNLTVFALVALGRFPYTSWLGRLSAQDEKIISWSLEVAGVRSMANRHIGELSDGEKQKVMIARALAQETDLLILDEPTAHLDSPNRIEIFHLLKELTNASKKAILISTHDIETALNYADRLWLVNQGNITDGIPEDLVLQGHVEGAFETDKVRFDYSRGGFTRAKKITGQSVHITGDELLVKWTRQAFERIGFSISEEAKLKILAEGTRERPEMRIKGDSSVFTNIEELLNRIQSEKE